MSTYWNSVVPVLNEIHQVKLVEAFVCHQKLHYAGVVDCVASYQGIPCVCDWKTADKPKNSISRLYDAPVQIAAYLDAVNCFYQDYDLEVNHGLVVVALPEMPAEVFWFLPEAMQEYTLTWRKRLKLFQQNYEHNLECQ
ncbi:MAG: PD-(D/E)XK nuclease family protein [Oscillatoria sp. PMC 1068.18]|nr:PD-(D/E)XK nuclease family protein [Oscillatoria sp. PMC 1076.18]MEC4988305.1 PD-(D/E)XK nuclease family protein [Oscillatoria sp. PMC 1068.18]